MAYGKNKGLAKGGKKGQKKKQLDPFMRKNWYDIKAPSYFNGKRGGKVAKTPVTKTTGQRIETDGLKGRIGEFNLADLKDEGDGIRDESNHKKIKLEVQEIQGKSCLTDFHGMSITRDRMCYLIKKRHTLVDVVADVKTTDGYTVRMFCMAFTKKNDGQVKCYSYCQSAQLKRMRKRMVQVMQAEAAKGQLSDLVKGLVVEKFENAMKAAVQRIFPLDPLCIHKVKVVKKPKMDIVKLMEIHEKGNSDEGAVVDDTNQDPEAKNLMTAA